MQSSWCEQQWRHYRGPGWPGPSKFMACHSLVLKLRREIVNQMRKKLRSTDVDRCSADSKHPRAELHQSLQTLLTFWIFNLILKLVHISFGLSSFLWLVTPLGMCCHRTSACSTKYIYPTIDWVYIMENVLFYQWKGERRCMFPFLHIEPETSAQRNTELGCFLSRKFSD